MSLNSKHEQLLRSLQSLNNKHEQPSLFPLSSQFHWRAYAVIKFTPPFDGVTVSPCYIYLISPCVDVLQDTVMFPHSNIPQIAVCHEGFGCCSGHQPGQCAGFQMAREIQRHAWQLDRRVRSNLFYYICVHIYSYIIYYITYCDAWQLERRVRSNLIYYTRV